MQPLAAWWALLHVCLLIGYLVLVLVLWDMARSTIARRLLILFGACNSLYLALDGLGVGLLAARDPSAADRLWGATVVSVLADATGASWAAAILVTAVSLRPNRFLSIGSMLAWLLFVISAFAGSEVVAAAGLLSRLIALGTGAWSVYQHGSSSMPIALLIFASVLRQHVGPEAALGLICVAIALATKQSNPVAASPP